MATNMITRFGMSKRFGLMGLATVESEYLGGGARLTCSDRTAADVDTEVMETLKQCYEEAKVLLSENREIMDKLAAHLIEKETISGKEFMKIYRAEKGIPEPEETEEETGKKPGKELEKSKEDDFFAKKDDAFFESGVSREKDAGEEQKAENVQEPSSEEKDGEKEERQEALPKEDEKKDGGDEMGKSQMTGRFSNSSLDIK